MLVIIDIYKYLNKQNDVNLFSTSQLQQKECKQFIKVKNSLRIILIKSKINVNIICTNSL